MKVWLSVALMMCVTSCAQSTQSQNNVCVTSVCQPIYGRAGDWDVISDDLARNILMHNELCAELNKTD